MSTLDRTSPSGLNDHVGYWLRAVSNHVSHAFGRRLERMGVTTAEWVILRQAYDANVTSVSLLAEQTGLTRGAVSKLVDRLVAKDLVLKTTVTADKRRQQVQLNAKGRRLVPQLARAADENDRYFFAHLSAVQRRQLVGMMRQIIARRRLRGVPVS